MFTQLYGTIQTFLAYVENGTLLQCQGKRKIANTSETLKLAVSICQLPGRADWWLTERMAGGGSGRLRTAATRRLKRERKTTLSSRSKKRGRCADQRLARAAPDMAGVVSLSVPAPSRCGPQGKASSTHIPSGRVDAITKNKLAMFKNGETLKGWASYHLQHALLRARANREPHDVSAEAPPAEAPAASSNWQGNNNGSWWSSPWPSASSWRW